MLGWTGPGVADGGVEDVVVIVVVMVVVALDFVDVVRLSLLFS
jgi:hypothetical protein